MVFLTNWMAWSSSPPPIPTEIQDTRGRSYFSPPFLESPRSFFSSVNYYLCVSLFLAILSITSFLPRPYKPVNLWISAFIRKAHQDLFPWLLIIPNKHNIQESWLCSVLCTLDFEPGAAAAFDRHRGIRQRHWNQPYVQTNLTKINNQ